MSKTRSKRIVGVLVAGVLTLAFSISARAQQPAQSAQQDTQASNEGELSEILVTAERRTENVLNVPASVEVISADTWAKEGAVNFRDITDVATGVQMNFAGVNTGIAIRGVGSSISAIGVENNVAVYIDGLYQADTVSLNEDLPDLDNVQILKGPQGTLYGRNATGGAIIISTKAPSTTWTGAAEAGYAEENDQLYDAYISGPINDRTRFLISGYSRTSDGYLKFSDPVTGLPTDRDVAPVKQQNIQAKFEGDVTDNFTAKLGYKYSLMSDASADQFTPVAHPSTTEPLPPLTTPLSLGPDYKSAADPDELLSFFNQGSLGFDWKTAIGTLSLTSGYTSRRLRTVYDLDGAYVYLVDQTVGVRETTGQANLNYQITAINKLDLVVGGTYYHDEWNLPYSIDVYLSDKFTESILSDQNRAAYQLYADGTYHFTDALSLSGGSGYNHEANSLLYGARTGTGATITAPVYNSATFKRATPRAALRYQFAPDSNVYVSYAQGFRSGNFQTGENPITNPAVKQETIEAYEVGLKMARQAFRFEAAAFYYNYSNLQVSAVIPMPGCVLPPSECGLAQVTTNGPKAHIYGAEMEPTINVTNQLALRAGATYLHAFFVSFPNAVGNGLNPANNTNTTETQDWSGNQLLRSAAFSGNVGGDYRYPMPFGNIVFTTNVHFTTHYVPTNLSTYGNLVGGALENRQRYVQGGYAVANAQIAWYDNSRHWSVVAYINNLTDKRYWEYLTGNTHGDYGVYEAPLVVGGRLKYAF